MITTTRRNFIKGLFFTGIGLAIGKTTIDTVSDTFKKYIPKNENIVGYRSIEYTAPYIYAPYLPVVLINETSEAYAIKSW